MNRKSSTPYLLIFLSLLFLLSISKQSSEKLHSATASMLTPLWGKLTETRLFLSTPLGQSSQEKFVARTGLKLTYKEEMAKLRLENQMLRNEIGHLKETIHIPETPPLMAELSQKHQKELQELLEKELESVPAQVIFRSRLSWNSSLWLNVGEAENQLLGRTVIAKDSPVVVGTSVVGVIDYVGKKQSRMRLITDSGLTPSVRAVRGSIQNRWTAQQIDLLIERIHRSEQANSENSKSFIQTLLSYKGELAKSGGNWYLAKGELQGSVKPFWRSRGQILKGIGFNYDFADEEGAARELRTGKPIDNPKGTNLSIIKVNDLLVTTGMDGIFPPGLLVAEVIKISPLREGDYYYELEAKPTAGNLDDLTTVFILPPLGYDVDEQPPYIWQ